MSQGITYRAYITPRISTSTYGSEVEITDRVELDGVSEILRSIDSEDYSFGVYAFNDVSLGCDNADGYFGGPEDSRSLFQFNRDLAKVRIVYYQDDTETVTFRGIVNEEGTRYDLSNDRLTLRVLGRDSAIRKTKVIPGIVGDATTIKNAIYAILNREEITRVLTVNLSDINPDEDGTVDDGSELDNRPTKEVLDEMLIASNSVLIINSSDEVIVKSRQDVSVDPPLELFGKGDLYSRENIIAITDYNSGLQRLFNAIKLNDVDVADVDSIAVYGLRKKEFTFSWLTDVTNITTLANRILREFKYPKIELRVAVATEIAKDYDLLDTVSVDYPLVKFPAGAFLPICGVTACGDTTAPLPKVSGSVVIAADVGFKIIEISENVKDFVTVLKLRQVGVTAEDGML